MFFQEQIKKNQSPCKGGLNPTDGLQRGVATTRMLLRNVARYTLQQSEKLTSFVMTHKGEPGHI